VERRLGGDLLDPGVGAERGMSRCHVLLELPVKGEPVVVGSRFERQRPAEAAVW
jgi:hypothetical protein